jgi:hypothetical protein
MAASNPTQGKSRAPGKKLARKATEGSTTGAEIDDRIAIARNNLRELVEQAASYSGASDEERMSQRIADQEATLERLKKG